MLIRYFPTDTKFEFMRFRRMSFPFSAAMSVLAVLLFFTIGMNFGIDFKGGTLVELRANGPSANVVSVRERADALGFGEVEVQEFGTEGREVSVRIELQPGGEQGQQAVVSRMRETFSADYEFRRVEVVGPRVSGELVQSGTLGILLSLLAILAYLWFRFEWQFAIGAVVATLHDIVLTIGFFAITQIEFNMTSIAAILTIIGYSLNDTVVVYDRIRETMRKYKRIPLNDMLDKAMNDTLTRTIITGVSTGLALLALTFFGGEVLKSFSYAMLFGLVVGTYSSVFIAAPILIYLGLKQGGEVATATPLERNAAQPAE
jgi:preprotein translocase SecF subunit